MAKISNTTPIMATISPGTDDRNEFPTHKSLWGQGGFDRVATKAEYDAISDERKKGKLIQVMDYDGNGTVKTFFHNNDGSIVDTNVDAVLKAFIDRFFAVDTEGHLTLVDGYLQGKFLPLFYSQTDQIRLRAEKELPLIKYNYSTNRDWKVGAGVKANLANATQIPGSSFWTDLIFTNRSLDVGLHYNSTTGIFTMPEEGIIHITVVLKSTGALAAPFNGYGFRIIDVSNGNLMVHLESDADGWIEEISSHRTIPSSVTEINETYKYQIKLNAGQQIKFQFLNDSGALSLGTDTTLTIDSFNGSNIEVYELQKKVEELEFFKSQFDIANGKQIVVDSAGNMSVKDI